MHANTTQKRTPRKIGYYLANITERNGGYEYATTIRFNTLGDPNKYLNRLAKYWHNDAEPVRGEKNVYEIDAGGIMIYAGSCKPITKETYYAIGVLVHSFTVRGLKGYGKASTF